MDPIVGGMQRIVDTSITMGKLDGSAIWAFFCLLLIGVVVYLFKKMVRAAKENSDVRLEESKADILVANAVNRLADEIKELQQEILRRPH